MYRIAILIAVSLFMSLSAHADDCTMTGGCKGTVGYMPLVSKDGKPTYQAKTIPKTGDILVISQYVNVCPQPLRGCGAGLRAGSEVEVIELNPAEPDFVIVRIISYP